VIHTDIWNSKYEKVDGLQEVGAAAGSISGPVQ
jgi:hypothetical protein